MKNDMIEEKKCTQKQTIVKNHNRFNAKQIDALFKIHTLAEYDLSSKSYAGKLTRDNKNVEVSDRKSNISLQISNMSSRNARPIYFTVITLMIAN